MLNRWVKSKKRQPTGRRNQERQSSLDAANYFRSGQTLNPRRKELKSDTSLRELSSHRRTAANLLILVLGGSGLLALMVWQIIASVEIVPNGVAVSDFSCYQQAVKDYFSKHPLERVKLFLKKDDLATNLKAHCPEVAAINSLNVSFLKPTVIKLDFKQPVAMWSLGETKYYVDKQGAAFLINYFEDPALKVVDKSGLDPAKVPAVASSQLLGFIGQVIALSAEKNLQVEKLLIPPFATRQVEVYYQGFGFPVKMLISRSSPEQVEDAARALSHIKTSGLNPQYLDVRIARRVYYQ